MYRSLSLRMFENWGCILYDLSNRSIIGLFDLFIVVYKLKRFLHENRISCMYCTCYVH